MHSRRAKQNFFFQFHCRHACYHHAKIRVNAFQGAPLFLLEFPGISPLEGNPQRNGSETIWIGIEPGWPANTAAKLVPGLLKPRLM